MKDYRQLIKELPSKTIVLACGKFNPPTIGHELLIKAVKSLAEQKNASYAIYASDSSDAKKNPLIVEKKIQYLNLLFPNTSFSTYSDNLSEVVSKLKETYRNVIIVTSADKVASMKKSIREATVISAMDNDPDSDDSVRSNAVKGLYEEFKKNLPSAIREIDSRRLMNDLRVGSGFEPIKEEIKLVKDKLRAQYFRGEIFKVGEQVEADGKQYEIVKRGSNHLLLKESSGKLVSKWIQNVKLSESYTRVEHNSDHKVLNHGADFKIKIHSKHHAKINGLNHGEQHEFKCMDGNEWGVQRRGETLHFAAHKVDTGISSNMTFHIPAAQFSGEETHTDIKKPTFQTIFANGDTMIKESKRKKLKSFKSTVRNNMAACPVCNMQHSGECPQDFRNPYDPMSNTTPTPGV